MGQRLSNQTNTPNWGPTGTDRVAGLAIRPRTSSNRETRGHQPRCIIPRSRQPPTERVASTQRLAAATGGAWPLRSEEHTSELQSRFDLVCRLLLEKKNTTTTHTTA